MPRIFIKIPHTKLKDKTTSPKAKSPNNVPAMFLDDPVIVTVIGEFKVTFKFVLHVIKNPITADIKNADMNGISSF